ncbi:MAG: hypothetical protein JWO06_72 [Bacteroidota bacterium]|nr:hypothetical protein [Bacteroidota bacterium]
MKHQLLRAVIITCCSFFFLIGNVNMAKASHSMGADISYQCLDPINHVYKIVVNFYRDCSGIDVSPTVQVNISSASCGQNITATLNELPCPINPFGGQPCEVSQLCYNSISQSTCNGGTLPGVEAFTYVDTVTLPMACTDWVMSYDICCRNAAVTNLQNPANEDLYVEATLNNVLDPNVSSPVFTTLPVPFICVNQPFSYNHGAIDANGDSLVYTLINPLGAGGVPITYTSGFSPTVPMTTAGSFVFNSNTGQMNFTPSQVQVAVVTVLVQAYHNGQLVGSTMRDIQVVVVNLAGCANPAPIFSGIDSASLTGGVFINNTLAQVCPGNTLIFNTLAYEPSGDSVFEITNISQAIPNALYTNAYVGIDSITGHFVWSPTGLDTGVHTFIVTVKNDHCPLANSQAYAVTIDVLPGTYAGPDLHYCPSGGPVQLQAYGGSQFTWTPTTGLSNPNIGNPLASPTVTTTYIVTSNLSSACKNKDTVTVFRVPDFTLNATQSKDTMCRFDIVLMNVTGDSTQAPYTYSWTPLSTITSSTIHDPFFQPDSTTSYVVNVTSSFGCTRKDTLRVVIGGQGPAITIRADRDKVCKGDTIHLNSIVSQVACGLNVIPCTGNNVIASAGTGTVQDFSGATPYNGFSEDAHMQMLFRASELQAAGLRAGTITDIIFDVAIQQSVIPYNSFTIRMGCTDRTELTDYVPGLAQVLDDPGYTVVSGLNDHVLTTAYDWDGISNLIVETCFTDTTFNFNNGDDIVNATSTTYNSIAYAGGFGVTGCTITFPQLGTSRPNIKFVACIAENQNVTYHWTPTNDIFGPDSLNPYVVLQQSTTYFLAAHDSGCEGAGIITLNIDTSYNVNAGPDLILCLGDTGQLHALITGSPPVQSAVTCGVNGTPCGDSSAIRSFNQPNSGSGFNTPFQAGLQGNGPGLIADERTQILYHASDLLAAGFTPGVVNSLGFNVVIKTSTLPFQSFNIKLGCTNKSQLDTIWEPTSLVYTNPFLITVQGWNDFAFQNTFNWDGLSNIVVEVCWANGSFPASGQDLTANAFVAYNSLLTNTDSVIPGCSLPVQPFFFGLWNELPNIRMNICSAPALPITYLWTPLNALSSDTSLNPYVSPAQTTAYTFTAYFGGRCPKSDTVMVTTVKLNPTIAGDTIICKGISVPLVAGGGARYIWRPAGTLSCDTCSTTIATPDSTTTYYVQLGDSLLGCSATDSVTVVVQKMVVTPLFTDTLVEVGSTVTLADTVYGGSGQYIYTWSPGIYLNDSSAANPVSTPLADVLYTLTVTSGPCADSTKINVRVHEIPIPVVVPNAFSPNGDGKNDEFYPVIFNNFGTVKTFRIYNRWGQLIHDDTRPWDGKFKGAGQPADTYIYYLVVSIPGKDDMLFRGPVSLLR